MTSANAMMIVQMSKTVIICTCSFIFIKFVVARKGHLKIVNFSVLPQRNCYFVCPDLLAKFSQFLLFSSSTKCAKFVEDLACEGFAPHSSMQVLPKFWKVLFAVFVCAQLPWNWLFKPIPLLVQSLCCSQRRRPGSGRSSQVHDVCDGQERERERVQERGMTYAWECKRTLLAHPTPPRNINTRVASYGCWQTWQCFRCSLPEASDLRLHRPNLCVGSEPAVSQGVFEPAQDRVGSRRVWSPIRWKNLCWTCWFKIGLRLRLQYM